MDNFQKTLKYLPIHWLHQEREMLLLPIFLSQNWKSRLFVIDWCLKWTWYLDYHLVCSISNMLDEKLNFVLRKGNEPDLALCRKVPYFTSFKCLVGNRMFILQSKNSLIEKLNPVGIHHYSNYLEAIKHTVESLKGYCLHLKD